MGSYSNCRSSKIKRLVGSIVMCGICRLECMVSMGIVVRFVVNVIYFV